MLKCEHGLQLWSPYLPLTFAGDRGSSFRQSVEVVQEVSSLGPASCGRDRGLFLESRVSKVCFLLLKLQAIAQLRTNSAARSTYLEPQPTHSPPNCAVNGTNSTKSNGSPLSRSTLPTALLDKLHCLSITSSVQQSSSASPKANLPFICSIQPL